MTFKLGEPISDVNPMTVVGLNQSTFSVQIANGASLSTAVDLSDRRLVYIVAPAAWTAAALTFQISYDGATFADLYDESGNEVSYTLIDGQPVYMEI